MPRSTKKRGKPFDENPLPNFERIAALTVDQDGGVIPVDDIKCVLAAIVEVASQTLSEGKDFNLPGLGKFTAKPFVMRENFGRTYTKEKELATAIRFKVSPGIKVRVRKYRQEALDLKESLAKQVIHRKPKPAR